MQVHKEKDRPDTLELRMWVYSSAKRADIQLRCFEYRESRTIRSRTLSALLALAGRDGSLLIHSRGAEASAIIYSPMETAKANSLRLDDYLLHLLSILPERAERNKNFEVDDLLPWSEKMKSWFSAV